MQEPVHEIISGIAAANSVGRWMLDRFDDHDAERSDGRLQRETKLILNRRKYRWACSRRQRFIRRLCRHERQRRWRQASPFEFDSKSSLQTRLIDNRSIDVLPQRCNEVSYQPRRREIPAARPWSADAAITG